MKYPRLFDRQPKITKAMLEEFQERGIIVSPTTKYSNARRTGELPNPTAGELVGYTALAAVFRDGEISHEDARVLLAIESNRVGGPRESHLLRLTNKVFSHERGLVLKRVAAWAKAKKKRK